MEGQDSIGKNLETSNKGLSKLENDKLVFRETQFSLIESFLKDRERISETFLLETEIKNVIDSNSFCISFLDGYFNQKQDEKSINGKFLTGIIGEEIDFYTPRYKPNTKQIVFFCQQLTLKYHWLKMTEIYFILGRLRFLDEDYVAKVDGKLPDFTYVFSISDLKYAIDSYIEKRLEFIENENARNYHNEKYKVLKEAENRSSGSKVLNQIIEKKKN